MPRNILNAYYFVLSDTIKYTLFQPLYLFYSAFRLRLHKVSETHLVARSVRFVHHRGGIIRTNAFYIVSCINLSLNHGASFS